MDIFGSELDDDLFESEKHRLVEDPHSWIPRSCEYEVSCSFCRYDWETY